MAMGEPVRQDAQLEAHKQRREKLAALIAKFADRQTDEAEEQLMAQQLSSLDYRQGLRMREQCDLDKRFANIDDCVIPAVTLLNNNEMGSGRAVAHALGVLLELIHLESLARRMSEKK